MWDRAIQKCMVYEVNDRTHVYISYANKKVQCRKGTMNKERERDLAPDVFTVATFIQKLLQIILGFLVR